jgi:UDPglucose--hexose-1-phosphate uridylyltransferase
MGANREEANKAIARLVRFGLARGLIAEADSIQVTNALMDLLRIDEPFDGALPPETAEGPAPMLEKLLDYAAAEGIIEDDSTTRRDLLDARIMGLFMPRQSEVDRAFWNTAREQSIGKATDDYYRMAIDSNYIRMDRIAKNDYWLAPTPYGDLEITINLSRPEKDPKEIAAERSMPQSSYPKCLLCVENVGYAGRLNHPARQNHRVISLELSGSPWFFQYSPYVYYNEHSIIFSREHTPMQISRDTFIRLLDFIGQFPHYFIGSNADLPIVGGSILNHDHFQGGRHIFPMEKAPVEQAFTHPQYAGLQAGIVKWPMSVIRLSSTDREELILAAGAVLKAWRSYSDPEADIKAYTAEGGDEIPHNTITPIARRNGAGEYELDLVLRNNRTDLEHPLGIFHPHADLHHIKKENIGLIEVMGLAVLPGRLKSELDEIKSILAGRVTWCAQEVPPAHPLMKHAAWIEELIDKYGNGLNESEAEEAMKREVGGKFLRVLLDAGVYKRNVRGADAFGRFMVHLGFRPDSA